MKNLAAMMKQASQMQQKMTDMQAELEAATVEGSAGAGMLRVRMNGKNELQSVSIDPNIVNPADVEMLQDLFVAAHADAMRKTETIKAEAMKKAAGGIELPPGLKLPF